MADPQYENPSISDLAAFSCAVFHARMALLWRSRKKRNFGPSPGRCEAMARQHEKQLREYALQAEIALQRAAGTKGGAS